MVSGRSTRSLHSSAAVYVLKKVVRAELVRIVLAPVWLVCKHFLSVVPQPQSMYWPWGGITYSRAGQTSRPGRCLR